MAIVFLEQRKTQRNLILVFFVLIFIISIVVWRGSSKEESPTTISEEFSPSLEKIVEIDFEIFKNPVLEKLQPFLDIIPLELSATGTKPSVKVGRENPFIPY